MEETVGQRKCILVECGHVHCIVCVCGLTRDGGGTGALAGAGGGSGEGAHCRGQDEINVTI